MNTIFSRKGWFALALGVCLWFTTDGQAQQRSGTTGNRSGSSYRGSTGGGYRGGSSYGSSGTRDYNNNTMVGDATITSDPETRRLIVVTDEDTAMNISQVISNLDRPKPQVLIKVVFLEVTHNNQLDVGVEGTWSKPIGNGITNNLGTDFGLAALGANGNPAGAGIYQILGENFKATIRAIAGSGKTEVLSRPSVLVVNNQAATITVGQSVPFITATRYDSVNGQINTVTYEDIGIILRVTPFITADGLVQMIVSPEISSLTDQTVKIAQGVDARVISKRSADTVVVTPDRMPVVIGGLMGTEKITQENKVPLLGDIPYLGMLFKRKISQDTKTELLIFLTPRVVHAPSELSLSTKEETDKAVMAPNAFSEDELERFLDGIPMKAKKKK